MNFFVKIALNTGLSDSSRVKALHFIGWLIRVKSKVIIRHKLLSAILTVIFPMMATHGEEDGNCEGSEDETESLPEAEDSRPNAAAAQVGKKIIRLANNIILSLLSYLMVVSTSCIV